KVYDDLLNPRLKFRRRVYSNFISQHNLDNLLISNLISTENIYQQERGILPEFRKINRLQKPLIKTQNPSLYQLNNVNSESGNLLYEYTKETSDSRKKEILFIQNSDIYNVSSLDAKKQLFLNSEINISRNEHLNFETFVIFINEYYPRMTNRDFDNLKNFHSVIFGSVFENSFILKNRITGNEIRNFDFSIALDLSNTINQITDVNHVNRDIISKAIFNSIPSINNLLSKNSDDFTLYEKYNTDNFSNHELILFNYFKNNSIRFSIWDNLNKFTNYYINICSDKNLISKKRKLSMLFRNQFFSQLIPRFLIELSIFNGKMDEIKLYENFSGLGIFNFSNFPQTVWWYL
ncbi:MAG: hypothetical protein WC337_11170, partial [Candidatus Muiribacteriota bacterium]